MITFVILQNHVYPTLIITHTPMRHIECAPRVFAQLMHSLLRKYDNLGIMFFQDDIRIAAKDCQEAVEFLPLVLCELANANLNHKLSKCHFGKRVFEYLGFRISEEEWEPGEAKISAIKKLPNRKMFVRFDSFLT